MVTMMQYYTDYRPFIIKNYKEASNKQSNKSSENTQSTKNTASEGNNGVSSEKMSKKNILNKAINGEIIGYMKDIATNVNAFKSAVNGFNSDIKYVQKYNSFDDSDEEMIESDLTKLTDSINNLKSIISENKSKASVEKIEEFDAKFSKLYTENQELFQNVGVSYEDGEFIKNEGLNSDYFVKNIDKYKEKAEELKKSTDDFLNTPMSSFVEFKTFKNYFNYSLRNRNTDSFKLIESGSILNIAL
ncbi:MAG: hypothetical protein ACK5LY_03960 [Lachnospirales bacterium]